MNKKPKYIIQKVRGVIIGIGEELEPAGYSKSVLQCFLPDDEELAKWSEKKTNAFIAKNNQMMEAICEFMNKNKELCKQKQFVKISK